MNRLAMGFTLCALCALSLSTASPASSQWLKIPLAGTPRTPDGKPNLTAPAPKIGTWFGYSIGKWEGDTFVADTVGFNDKSWLDDTTPVTRIPTPCE